MLTRINQSSCDEFCIEIQKDSNPAWEQPPVSKAFGLNHLVTRVYAIGTGRFSITCDGKPFGTNRIYMSCRVVKAEGLGDM